MKYLCPFCRDFETDDEAALEVHWRTCPEYDSSIGIPTLDSEQTYKIVRFCFDDNHPDHRKVIKQGLTLAEAQEHCQREDTHGDGWFDGYDKES